MKKFMIAAATALTLAGCAKPSAEICSFRGGREAAVSLTFDDGIVDHYTLVAPQLNRLGIHGTFWINPGRIEHDDDYSPYLTWEMCRQMAAAGHEISNHSWSHPHLTRLTPDEVREEVRRADDAIETEVGIRPITFCFPYNSTDSTVTAICGEGRVGMRTFQEGQGQANNHSTAESLASWLRGVIDSREWGVTMTHGIHNGWDQWEDETILWNFYKDLAAKRDSVWIGTFAEVSAYIAERDATTLEASVKGDVLTLTPSCSLDPSLYREKLTAKVDWKGETRYLDFDPFGGAQTYDLSDPLLGKTINVFGDSYVRNHVRPYTETWHCKLAERHSMVYNNYGINGSSVAFDRSDRGFGVAMLDRFEMMTHKADYILVIAGHNDAYYITNAPDSTAKCLERLDLFCKGLVEKYPEAKIGFVTPWAVDKPNFPEIIAAIKTSCAKYGIPVLDAASTSGIDPNDEAFREKYFQTKWDNAHLNPAGHDLLVDWGEEFLLGL